MDDFKRRDFIKLSALGFAGVVLQLRSISAFAQQANGHQGRWNADTPLNWDAFIERLTLLARRQHEPHWDQERYIGQVKRLLVQCDFPEFGNVRQAIQAYENRRPNWFESTSLHHEVDFQVSLFQFEQGEYIPHHDHPEMTGVLNVVSGSILARNYDVDEHLATEREVVVNGTTHVLKKCMLRETQREVVQAGCVSMLSAHKGNIHSIMPNAFTQLVDVFTPAYKSDTSANWYIVNEEAPLPGGRRLYEAEYSTTRFSE